MSLTPSNPSYRAALAALLVCLLAGLLAAPPALAGTSGAAVGVPTNVSVTDATLERSTVEAGEEAAVEVTVTNRGDARERYAVELTGDGRAYVQTLVTLDAGESRTVTFRQRFERPGTYDLAANGVPAGTLTVSDGRTTGVATGTTTGPETNRNEAVVPLQAWVLLVLVVGALGAGGVYIVRGRR